MDGSRAAGGMSLLPGGGPDGACVRCCCRTGWRAGAVPCRAGVGAGAAGAGPAWTTGGFGAMLDSTKAISKGRVDTRSRFTSTVENVLSTCTRWSSDKPSVSFRSSTLTSSLKPSEDSTEDFMRSVPRRWSMTILWNCWRSTPCADTSLMTARPSFVSFLRA